MKPHSLIISDTNSLFANFLIEELKGNFFSEKLESLSVVFEDLVKIPGLKFTINQEVSRWSKDDKPTYFYDVKIEGVSNELQRVIADGLAPILYSS